MRVLGSVVPVQNSIVCCARAWKGVHWSVLVAVSHDRTPPTLFHLITTFIFARPPDPASWRFSSHPSHPTTTAAVSTFLRSEQHPNDIQNTIHPSRILGQIGSNIAGHTVPPRCIAPWPAIRRNETSVRWAPLASSGPTPHAALAASTPRPPPRLLPPSAATTPTMATHSSRALQLARPGRPPSSPTKPWRPPRPRYPPSTTTARTALRAPCVWYV